MSRIIKPVLIFAAILLFPAVALAVDMDFYTYGGFEPVVDSFTQLSLIFGNTSYQTLYYTAVVAGIACGATAAYMSLIGGRGGNILGWAPIAALGIAIYVGLFVPKGNIVVYDPVFNKFQTIPNVPNGVVIVAGSLNAIERGLVEIVSNSASPTAYQTQAGGIGFMGLYNLTTMPATASNSFLDMNVNRYIQDCVSFALNNPGSGLTVDELRKTTTSFATSFSKASNPAIYTLYYSAAVPQGQAQGCDVDYAMVFGTDLTAVALQNNVNSACSTLNFDVTDPLQLNQCQTMVLNLATGGGLTAGNMDSLMQQIYLYHRLDQFYQSGNTTAITNYNFLLNASGSMKAADEWIPVLKAVLTAIAVALIPFLAIFIPTPICGKALNLMFGMFLWLALWGVCDAIIHQFAMSYGFKVWDAVRNNNLGMDALYFFPNMTVKALAMFGTLRMGGLLLATALTTMLTRFGGSVMGMLAGNITGQIQSAGVTGERATTDPSGRATSIESNTRAMPTEAWAASNPLSSREGELFASKHGGTQAYDTMSANFGGPQGAAEMNRLAGVGRESRYAGAGKGAEAVGLPNAFGLGRFDAEAGYHATEGRVKAYGTASEYGGVQSAPDQALADVAAANGLSPSALKESMAKFNTAMGYGEQTSVKGYTGIKDDIVAGAVLGEAKGTQDAGQIMSAAQIRAAANYAAPDSWKSNPDLYDSSKHELTDQGVARFLAAREGLISYSTEHGRATQELTSEGKLIRSSEEGTFKGEGLSAIAQRLDNAGLHHQAAELRKLDSANIGISYDGQGRPVTAVGSHGGKVEDQDRGIHDEGQTIRRGDNTHIGNDTRTGNDTHVGNTLRTGDDTHIGSTLREGNDADTGDKSRTGNLVTIEDFTGKVGSFNFTHATMEMRGNTFTAYGHTEGGGWQIVSGQTFNDAQGERQFLAEKGRDEAGMGFTPQSAMRSVVTEHRVPESAFIDTQSKQAFATSFVEAMQELRSLSTVNSKEASFGGNLSGSRSLSKDHSRSGPTANLNIGSRFTGTTRESINTQVREAMKIMDKHENTPEGRQAAASDLLQMYDDNAASSSNRLGDLFHGGAWKRK
jgi:hypothetical protein